MLLLIRFGKNVGPFKGDRGDQGPAGVNGSDGQQGPVGNKGDRGDTGPQGIAGTKGDTGQDGQAGTGVSIKGSDSKAKILAIAGQAGDIVDGYR